MGTSTMTNRWQKPAREKIVRNSTSLFLKKRGNDGHTISVCTISSFQILIFRWERNWKKVREGVSEWVSVSEWVWRFSSIDTSARHFYSSLSLLLTRCHVYLNVRRSAWEAWEESEEERHCVLFGSNKSISANERVMGKRERERYQTITKSVSKSTSAVRTSQAWLLSTL